MGGILAVIPARGGSKRLPGKNIRSLGGRPLIAWSIEDGLQAQSVNRVIVSTDDREIADVARSCGAEVPFLRPSELAGDKISDTPVLAHAADWYREDTGTAPELLILLRPTTPFRADGLIDRCVAKLRQLNSDSVRTVRNVGHMHPYWMLQVDASGFATPIIPGKSVDTYYQSQLLPPVFKHDGYCDLIKASNLPHPCPIDATLVGVYGDKRAVLLNEDGPPINIDTLYDWRAAEAYLSMAD